MKGIANNARVTAMGVVAGVLLTTSAGLGPAASASALAEPHRRPIWAARYDGTIHGVDSAIMDAVSPDGSMLFVTGTSAGSTGNDITTIAYDATTGARLWTAGYDGPAHGEDDAWGVAVDPNGSAVLVTGQSFGGSSGFDYVTIAYEPGAGSQLWARRYDGPGRGEDTPISLGTSPDGTRVYVTGTSLGNAGNLDFATVALRIVNGSPLWVARYDGPAGGDDSPGALTVGPDGAVYAMGGAIGIGTGSDTTTIKYNPINGQQVWVARYDGPAHGDDGNCILTCVQTSADGSKVYTLGQGPGIGTGEDLVTIAYQASTGAELWATRYDGSAHLDDFPADLAVLPDDSGVVITAVQLSLGSAYYDDVTIRYEASSGLEQWATLYDNPSHGQDFTSTIVATPDSSMVVLTGLSNFDGTDDPVGRDMITQAYAASNGALLWTGRFDGTAHSQDDGVFVVLSPAGDRAYVTGDSTSPSGTLDFQTLAYRVA
jgi:hypothetical protein